MASTSEGNRDLEWIVSRMDAGQLTAHIDRVFPLASVPQAHAYVEAGHKQGNVVIQVVSKKEEAVKNPRHQGNSRSF